MGSEMCIRDSHLVPRRGDPTRRVPVGGERLGGGVVRLGGRHATRRLGDPGLSLIQI